MPMFNPQTKYDIIPSKIPLSDFHLYADEFVVRPPYQRKAVWNTRKKQDLLDSLFRRYYVPHIVIREVRLDEHRAVKEIIDGQQRITTAQDFFSDQLRLPTTLEDVHPDLVGLRYSELPSDVRRFVDRELVYQADIVKGIDDSHNPEHQRIATEIFWRLQQGETLNYMEVAHARLNSLARNFVVKYADDQRFDYERYVPIDQNPDKHRFFDVIDRKNDRMQHLALLTRFLIFEDPDFTDDIRDIHIIDYIDHYQRTNGIGDDSMETMPHGRRVLDMMNRFYGIFKDDPMVTNGDGMKEFRTEYFVISVYRLLRHLVAYYVFTETEKALFRRFVIEFHNR